MELVVLTVATDITPTVRNYIRSLHRYRYRYMVLGMGEAWGGWQWRTRQYIEAIKRLGPNEIVCVTDANDVLFTKPAPEFLRRFLSLKSRVVIGSEANNFGGEMLDPMVRETVNLKLQDLMGPEDWRRVRNKFPNCGFMVGYRNDLLQLLLDIRDEKDDQNGVLNLMLQNYNRFRLDTHNILVGNTAIRTRFWLRGPVDIAPWEIDLDLWSWEPQSKAFRNTVTGGSPCVLHFPGKNWEAYNKMGKQLDIPNFEPVLHVNPFEGMQAAPDWLKVNFSNGLFLAAVILMLFVVVILPASTYGLQFARPRSSTPTRSSPRRPPTRSQAPSSRR